MKPSTFRLTAATTLAITAVCLGSAPGRLGASEISATHVVFEKPVKMKKADTFLYLPLLDQSRKSDSAGRDRLIDCRVFAESAAGPLVVKGRLKLRLLGEVTGSAASWRSSVATELVDGDGRARFQAAAVHALIEEAETSNAEALLMWLEFDGGKGKKVTRLTVDCENREGES